MGKKEMEKLINNKKIVSITTLIIAAILLYLIYSYSNKVSDIKDNTGIVPNIEEHSKDGEVKDAKNIDNTVNEEIIEVSNYLNHGTNYYNEKVNSEKSLKILENMEDSFYTNYYKGYSYEIIGNYNEALKFYNDGAKLSKGDKKLDGLVFNQIGHVYDLMGNIEEANTFYIKAEELGLELGGNLVNRGRYEYRKGNYDLAEQYFNKVLEQNLNSFVNAEIYFNLSTIYQNKTDGLKKSIDLAEKGIKEEKNYPYNYLSLAISYIIKSGENLDDSVELLKKTISIYPSSSLAYKYLGIYYYIKDDFDNSIKNFELQLENSQKDILLMSNDKENIKNDAIYDLSKTYALKGNEEKSLEYLNMILDGENKNYYYSFLRDISFEDSPFLGIMNSDNFRDNLANIVKIYKK